MTKQKNDNESFVKIQYKHSNVIKSDFKKKKKGNTLKLYVKVK